MRYNISSGKTKAVNIKGIRDIPEYRTLRPKPLLLSSGYLIDMMAGKACKAFNPRKQNAMISEDGKSLLFYDWELAGGTVQAYDLDTGERTTVQLPTELTAVHTPFSPDAFVIAGNELQILYENYLYAVDVASGRLVSKTCILESFKHVLGSLTPASSFCSWAVDNGKWYVMTQKPTKFDSSGGARNIAEIQPLLYSFDMASHDFKLIWKMKSYRNNGAAVLIDIEGGYLWCYTYNGIATNYWMRLPLNGLNKAAGK
jgi:hypothetical protein